MTKQFEAIVENGCVRPVEPLPLPEGAKVSIIVSTDDDQPREVGHREFLEVLQRLRESSAEFSDEWWNQFQQDLERNRTPLVAASGAVEAK